MDTVHVAGEEYQVCVCVQVSYSSSEMMTEKEGKQDQTHRTLDIG